MSSPVAKTVFMFSGQGSHYYQMGKHLFETSAVFRASMLRLDQLAFEICGQRVLESVYGARRFEIFDRTAHTHPAIFMVEVSLARCLIAENLKPDLALGASLGSIAAAVVAGCIEEDDALALVIEQALAFERSCERGGMTAIMADPSRFCEPFLCEHSELAGINFHSHFVVSAPCHALDAIEAGLKRRDIAHQRLAVSFAFHSRWIEPARERLSAFMHSVRLAPATMPIVCCERATTLTQLGGDFFWRVARHPIRFRDAIAHLERQGPHRYIDLGPSGTLATFVRYGLGQGSASSAHAVLTPYGRDAKNLAALLASR